MPIGPLMIEHRLIERMIEQMRRELATAKESRRVDSRSIDIMIDFIRTYADRCHHGKEEGILFRDLAKKQLSSEHAKTMDELIKEHDFARRTVKSLENANERYVLDKPSSLDDVISLINVLIEFYPHHIAKEDGSFFIPSMDYFTKQEQDNMLQEFWEFDRNMIHEKYREVVERMRGVK